MKIIAMNAQKLEKSANPYLYQTLCIFDPHRSDLIHLYAD